MFEHKGILYKMLRLIRFIIPTEHIRTLFYLNIIYRPRKIVRRIIGKFYRMDHVYKVLMQCEKIKDENLSILEFGVADGYSFIKMLYATRYMDEEDRVEVHGFDTFEGLPEKDGVEDQTLMDGIDVWREGDYKGRYETLVRYCDDRYNNFKLHRGTFENTIKKNLEDIVIKRKPVLVWIDCDYYSSTKSALLPILPYIPTGCVMYFDDIHINYRSSMTGQMKFVKEINEGVYGENYELVLDNDLSWDSRKVYRFINLENEIMYTSKYSLEGDPVRKMDEGSPLP